MRWRERCRTLIDWARLRRRRLLWIAGVVVFFYVLGYFAPKVSLPGMCRVYG